MPHSHRLICAFVVRICHKTHFLKARLNSIIAMSEIPRRLLLSITAQAGVIRAFNNEDSFTHGVAHMFHCWIIHTIAKRNVNPPTRYYILKNVHIKTE